MQPEKQANRLMEKTNPLLRLWNLIALEKKEISSIYFYAILSGLLQLSVPLGVQAIIGFVLGASMVTSVYILIIVIVIAVLLVGIMQINQMKIIEKIQQKIFTNYSFEFAQKIPRFDLKKADHYYLPEKVNRFFDIISIQKGLSKILLDIPTASIQLFLGLIILSLYNLIFVVFGFLLITILWAILKFTSKKGLRTSLQESTHKYAVVAWLQEMARVIQLFKSSDGTNLNYQKTDKNVVHYLHSRTAHFNVLLIQFRSLVVFKVVITVAMLTVGTYLLLNQELNIGEFIATEIIILSLISAVEKLIGGLDGIYDVITGLEKLASVTEIPAEKNGKQLFSRKNNGIGIELIDFSFEFQNDKKVLQNINLNILPNTMLCISGNEGSGKSTFLKALDGNYNDFSGSFLINQIPLLNYNLASLRSNIGYYLNRHELFNGTIAENIYMGREDISFEKIIETARAIGIGDFLNSLPDGFETEIDPGGVKMPGTLIKQILLLRAFVHEPKLLLLEEPWQGLPLLIQQKIKEFLFVRKESSTIIVVSNDENFAKSCDSHIELQNGRISQTNN